MFGSSWLLLLGRGEGKVVLPSRWGRESVSSASLGFDDLDDFCAPASLKDRDPGCKSIQIQIYPDLSTLCLHLAFCLHQTILALAVHQILYIQCKWRVKRLTKCCWSLADWNSSVGVPKVAQATERQIGLLRRFVGFCGVSLGMWSNQHLTSNADTCVS